MYNVMAYCLMAPLPEPMLTYHQPRGIHVRTLPQADMTIPISKGRSKIAFFKSHPDLSGKQWIKRQTRNVIISVSTASVTTKWCELTSQWIVASSSRRPPVGPERWYHGRYGWTDGPDTPQRIAACRSHVTIFPWLTRTKGNITVKPLI